MFVKDLNLDDTTPFVLTRYYQSIKLPIKIGPDNNIAKILFDAAVQHFKLYPFNSLYFNLREKEIPLDRNALIQQLLEGKGGSCFHHNAVFQAILADNGIKSRFISCLVHDPLNPGKTFNIPSHVAIVFEFNGQEYLFDPGWDGTSLSIYPIPEDVNSVVGDGKHQIRRTNNPNYPFSFEEVKSEGEAIVRYDFNSTSTELANFKDAINYLNSEDYAFNTLFLFTQINSDNLTIRLVNRRLIIQTAAGEELENTELPEDISVIEKLTNLLGPLVGLMTELHSDDFKNPNLGDLICQSTATTLESKVGVCNQ